MRRRPEKSAKEREKDDKEKTHRHDFFYFWLTPNDDVLCVSFLFRTFSSAGRPDFRKNHGVDGVGKGFPLATEKPHERSRFVRGEKNRGTHLTTQHPILFLFHSDRAIEIFFHHYRRSESSIYVIPSPTGCELYNVEIM